MSYRGDGYNNSLMEFEEAMGNGKNTQGCEQICLPNCDETTYKFNIDTTELDTEELCSSKDTRVVIEC
jgi:hypothetical protein